MAATINANSQQRFPIFCLVSSICLHILVFLIPAKNPDIQSHIPKEIVISLEKKSSPAKFQTTKITEAKNSSIKKQEKILHYPKTEKASQVIPGQSQKNSAKKNNGKTNSQEKTATKGTDVPAPGIIATEDPEPFPGNSLPVYPELSRKRNQSGITAIRCIINEHGNILKVEVAKSSGFKLLDEAALKAARNWKFKVAKKNGVPVQGSIIIPVEFRLQ